MLVDQCTTRSVSIRLMSISGYCARNSATTGTMCRRPKTTGAVTSQFALGRGVFAGRDAFGLADLVEDAAAGGDIGCAGFGQ
jgi:hypothetical protein